MEEVYKKKPNGRYERLGYSWTGFPADGIWLVQDGRHNQRLIIGLNEAVPIHALQYRMHEDGIIEAVQKRERKVGHGLSLADIVRVACDYFAHVAGGVVR